jgi:hypothetical protein
MTTPGGAAPNLPRRVEPCAASWLVDAVAPGARKDLWESGEPVPAGVVEAALVHGVEGMVARRAAETGHEVPGLLPFVTDAIASRGGDVLLHSMNTDETPATTRFWTAVSALSDDRRPRLTVTYQSATPRPMEHPRGQALGHVRPAPIARPARPPRGAPTWQPT